MNALHWKPETYSASHAQEKRGDGRSWLSAGIFAVALGVILYGTLFPFDFVGKPYQSLSDIFAGFDWDYSSGYLLVDVPVNVLLFIPFGFGLAGLACRRRTCGIGAVLLVFAAGLAFSLALEILQVFLVRFSSFVDVAANATGALIGAVIYWRSGSRLLGAGAKWAGEAFSRVPVGAWFLGAGVGLVITMTAVYAVNRSITLGDWHPGYPLLVGNEATGDRPWSGSLSRFYLADRALDPEEVQAVFGGETSTLLADYRFSAFKNSQDHLGNLPALTWQGDRGTRPISAAGVQIDADGWLESKEAGSEWTRMVKESGEFSLGVIARPSTLVQSGPVRIISLSADPYARNFTLGQEGADLVIRLRMPATGENGSFPEVVFPGVFADGASHHLLVTFREGQLSLYIDRPDRYFTFDYRPEVAMFWPLRLRDVYQIRYTRFGQVIVSTLFAGLVSAPLVVLLGLGLARAWVETSEI